MCALPLMHLPLRTFTRVLVACFALFVATLIPVSLAQGRDANSRSPSSDELIVTNGSFSFRGKQQPATLRNLVDAITQRYHRANIILVGVEDILIQNLVLRLAQPSPSGNDPGVPPLHLVFAALKAASNDTFRVEGFGPNDFLLSTVQTKSTEKSLEAFNLSALVSKDHARHLARQVREMEASIPALEKVFGPDNPRVADARQDLALRRALLANAGSPVSSEKLIDQIEVGTTAALQLLESKEPLPKFSFHPGTNLLLVVGSTQAITVTQKIIAALQKGDN
jgi:hypothetical protein